VIGAGVGRRQGTVLAQAPEDGALARREPPGAWRVVLA